MGQRRRGGPPGRGAGPDRTGSLGFILAIQALPTVIFFMAFSALLYQAGILQRGVNLFSRLFVRVLGASGAESMAAAANVFVGAEVAGMVRPFLAGMTSSEYFCLLTASMANVASSTLGGYVTALQPYFPNIAGQLVSASVISAPAAIVIAKITEPETGAPVTAGRLVDPEVGRYPSWMEAVIARPASLLPRPGGPGQRPLGLGRFAGRAGGPGVGPPAGLVGLAPDPGHGGAKRLRPGRGPAFGGAGPCDGDTGPTWTWPSSWPQGQLVHARSALVASYALCGFAHVGSVAIFVGGFSSLVPGRMGELAGLGLKSFWAATLATIMVGCVGRGLRRGRGHGAGPGAVSASLAPRGAAR